MPEATKMKVMLVDDDASIRTLVGNNLRKVGYEVDVAANGEEGFSRAMVFKPDIFVSDIMMPVMDGVQLLEKLRQSEEFRESYVILLTAKDRSKDMLEGFGAAADDYITKPFSIAELKARVAAGARIKMMQQELRETNLKLKDALQQQTELLGLAAHELRNPLHIISTYVSLLEKDVIPAATIKDVCLRRAKEVSGLVDEMLDITRIDAGIVTLSATEKISISYLLAAAKELYSPIAEEKGVNIKIDCPQELSFIGDESRMAEVFNTMLENAIRISCKSGSEINIKAVLESGDWLTISVDLSSGDMLGDYADRVFDLPSIENGNLLNLDGTTILGFAIVRKLITLMSGQIFAENAAPGRGPRFGFSIPQPEA